MSTAGADLHGFAYGEHVDALSDRSLGFRLLAPAQPLPWCIEVEALARRLQGAPYPDHWPPTDLFCSLLLGTGQRLIAVARYGLVDHTPNHRRGGLELVGVVGAAGIDATEARAIYHWLKRLRAETDDLHALGGTFSLAEVIATAPPLPPPPDPTPVLPIRLWREGALLFAATAPSDPDHRLNLLEQGAGHTWQWLPLVGQDFPIPSYAQRGPLVAWTPHLAGVALKLDNKPAAALVADRKPRSLTGILAVLLLLVALTLANLALTLSSRQGSGVRPAQDAEVHADATGAARPQPSSIAPAAGNESRARFARALYNLLAERGSRRELTQGRAQLLAEYERLAQERQDLHLEDTDTEGKLAVATVNLLSQRSANRVEEMVKKALSDKGFHPNLVKTACEFVHDQLAADH